MKTFEKYGLQIPDILLPREMDLTTWSVIACDQYTQDRDYWAKASATVKTSPSTLNLIFPEVYLNDGDEESRIKSIHDTMNKYLSDNVFGQTEEECVYIERTTEYGRTRKGLIAAIDLDRYEWKPFSKALIRATEATVPERIPPRMKIRNGASLELPHIMLLTDDPDHLLVEKAGEYAKKGSKLYQGDLMLNAGHIDAWKVKGSEAESIISSALESIAQKGTDKDGNVFLFAVGDGNHSLATAKAVWDQYKQTLKEQGIPESEIGVNPVRYALVEIVNIYDEGLTFEPIHRALFNCDSEKLRAFVNTQLNGTIKDFTTANQLSEAVSDQNANGARFGFISKCDEKVSYSMIQTDITDLAISHLQPVLDRFIKENDGVTIDYIHGSQDTVKLGSKPNCTGIILPPIAKNSFFATISNNGPLPRKSFSMGEASEKRFYVESRRLF